MIFIYRATLTGAARFSSAFSRILIQPPSTVRPELVEGLSSLLG
jgi:hypothetical protein